MFKGKITLVFFRTGLQQPLGELYFRAEKIFIAIENKDPEYTMPITAMIDFGINTNRVEEVFKMLEEALYQLAEPFSDASVERNDEIISFLSKKIFSLSAAVAAPC